MSDKILGSFKITKKVVNEKTIGTHDNILEIDEIFSIAILKMIPKYKDHFILRTNEKKALEKCDIVVNVGLEYDVKRKRFDHNHYSFCETFNDQKKIPLSSTGLIWKNYGKMALKNILPYIYLLLEVRFKNLEMCKFLKCPNEKIVDYFHTEIYKSFIEGIDAVSNRVEQYIPILWKKDYNNDPINSLGPQEYANFEEKYDLVMKKKYEFLSLAEQCLKKNLPHWFIPYSKELMDHKFLKCVEWGSKYFLKLMERIYKTKFMFKTKFNKFIKNFFNDYKGQRYMLFEEECDEAMNLILEYENEHMNIEGELLYLITPRARINTQEDEHCEVLYDWNVVCIHQKDNRFILRKPLPEEWAGLRSNELASASGISSAIFVHKNRFIGICKEKNDAIKMAEIAISTTPKENSYIKI